ncbi:MAG: hypothetical protein PHO01_12705 [Desulfotomaculaceae bacterium]|nr:hypothetical protein [Desulfotomaculaceae bacterium]
MIETIVNNWLEEGFENDNCCDHCGRLTTTVKISVAHAFSICLCKNCLELAKTAIDKATLSKGN